jgi:hypothetical protein
LIILVALAVVVLAGRANTVSERKQRDVYADRLELLKNRLESEASSGEVGGSLNALVDGESGVVGAQSQKNGRKPKQPVSAS